MTLRSLSIDQRQAIKIAIGTLDADTLYRVLPAPAGVDAVLADAIRILVMTLVRPSSTRAFAGNRQISRQVLKKMTVKRLRAQHVAEEQFDDALHWLTRHGVLIPEGRRHGYALERRRGMVREEARPLLTMAYGIHELCRTLSPVLF